MANSIFLFPFIGDKVTPGPITIDGPLTLIKNAIGVTSAPVLSLVNNTPAAAGAQQYSPGLSQIGQGWKTNATAGSQPVEVRWEIRPVQGAAAPTFTYHLMGRVNNGAWDNLLRIDSVGNATYYGSLIGTSNVFTGASAYFSWNGRSLAFSPVDGAVSFTTSDPLVSGIRLQFAAAPTIASGFGTTPSITADSTDTAGQVNVGTGGAASAGIINFATTWASAPFVVAMNASTGLVLKAIATTTQLTITSSAAFTAGDLINWICIGAN